MKKSRKDLETNQLGLFSSEVFHASHTPAPGSEWEQTTLATSGRRCLGLYASANPNRSWGRMFLASLVGTTAWYSTKCKLTWKVKVSKSRRSYFQLAVSALPTGETVCGLLPTEPIDRWEEELRLKGSQHSHTIKFALLPTPSLGDVNRARGSAEYSARNLSNPNRQRHIADMAKVGLLPTPDCNNHRDGTSLRKDNNMMEGGRHGVSLHHMAAHGLLGTPTNSMVTWQDFVQSRFHSSERPPYALIPTPQARDSKNGSKPGDGRTVRKMEEGWSMNLNDLAASALLPTPRAAEHKGTGPKGSKSNDHRVEVSPLDAVVVEAVGEEGVSTQLSHRFVMEMMGFPPDWVESAFAGTIPGEAHDFTTFPNEFPTVVPEWRDMMDGILGEAGATNPETGKPLNYSRLNKEGLKMGGNAIVPPVLLQIFIALEKSWE